MGISNKGKKTPWSQAEKKSSANAQDPTAGLDDEFEHFLEALAEQEREWKLVAPHKESMSKDEFCTYSSCQSLRALRYWIKKGMPVNDDGSIPALPAAEWLVDNGLPKGAPPMLTHNWQEYESQKSFSEKHGLTQVQVNWLIKKGLPCAYNGWVHISRGERWIKSAQFRCLTKHQVRNAEGYETRTDFADRCGVHFASVDRWKKAGLPCAPSGDVNIKSGLRWVLKHRRGSVPDNVLARLENNLQ